MTFLIAFTIQSILIQNGKRLPYFQAYQLHCQMTPQGQRCNPFAGVYHTACEEIHIKSHDQLTLTKTKLANGCSIQVGKE